MQLHTTQFGDIEIMEDKVITFKEGIPGFEHLKHYILLQDEEGVFYYLQSIEEGTIAFPILQPHTVKADYAPQIHETYFEQLGGGKDEAFTLFVITTLREQMEESTVNLQAPLLIHTERRVGVQALVENEAYYSRHRLMDLLQERSA